MEKEKLLRKKAEYIFEESKVFKAQTGYPIILPPNMFNLLLKFNLLDKDGKDDKGETIVLENKPIPVYSKNLNK